MWYLVLVALFVGLGGGIYIGYKWGARAIAKGNELKPSIAQAEGYFKKIL